jgi:hypothetical protein
LQLQDSLYSLFCDVLEIWLVLCNFVEVSMEARATKSATSRDWKEVYKAALFEDDTGKIPQRIADAERALAARALELCGAEGDQDHEQQAMENAKYFLLVLGNTLGNAGREHVSQTKRQPGSHATSDHANGGQSLFVPAGGQDLHATFLSPPFCNE